VFLALYFVGLALLAGFLAVLGARSAARGRRSSRFYAAAFGLVLGYLFTEFAMTAFYGFTWAGTSLYLFDKSGKTVHFDPIRGYLLTKEPSRWSRFNNGVPEYVGVLKGNSQGFPSQTDFGPARPDSSTRRIAVLGDSFSAADYIETNWPDRAQALAQSNGEKLQLLNFSLDGIGLANWWSILTRLIAPQKYELDGIVFVVFEWDLERRFWVAENRGTWQTWRRCPSWDPQTYPATLEQTSSCANRLQHTYILTDREFDEALKRKWPASIPRWELRPPLAMKILDLSDWWLDFARTRNPEFSPEQKRLIEDIRQFISAWQLPALVVFLPERDRLINSAWEGDPNRAETMAFAKMIGAVFADGSGAFANMSASEIRKCFFRHDGHWNQSGSDRFAKFMLDLLPKSFPGLLQPPR
jgi:hypothetical protein